MKTKIFLSWGGATSRDIAKETKRWMESVVQAVEPFYSDRNIDSGSYFPTELIKPLEATNIGVICLTKECLNNKWVHFEAGNLFKGNTDSRVHTLLFDLESSQVESPLSFFQHKKFEKQRFKEFMEEINKATGEFQLDAARFEDYFEREWPAYEKKINEILTNENNATAEKEKRPLEDMVEEILELTRSNRRGEYYNRRSPDLYREHTLVSKITECLGDVMEKLPKEGGKEFLYAFTNLTEAINDANAEVNGLLAKHLLENSQDLNLPDDKQSMYAEIIKNSRERRKTKNSRDS